MATNDHPLQVLQVIATGPGFGGGPRHVYDLATRLKALGITSTVLEPLERQSILLTMLKEAGVPTLVLAMDSAFDKRALRELPAVFLTWLAAHPDEQHLVHIHGFRAGILARRALGTLARAHGVPIIYTEHLMTNDYRLPSRIRQYFQQRYLRAADKFTTHTIAVSQAVRQFLLDKKITTPEKITVIPNGVNFTQTANSGQRPEAIPGSNFQLPTSNFRLGMLGSLVPLKAHADVIEALPLINQNLAGVTLHIVGDGPLRPELDRLARRLGVNHQIVWHGHVEDPRPLLRNWDILVSASTSESFGLGIAEAMAEGVPVIATAVGGVPELVTAETGRLIPVHEPHELAKVIIDLLPKQELRAQMGQAGRQRIKDHFSLDQMVAKTADLYKELTS
jgi:glycosyltransferase involved in cell wall biosynthesis